MEKQIYITEAHITHETTEAQIPFKDKSNLQTDLRILNAKINHKSNLNNFPCQTYYDKKRIKPGAHLYKLLLQVQQKKINNEYNGPELDLPIPQTLCLNDNSLSIIYTENGKIKVVPYASCQLFMSHVNVQSPDGPLFPAAIQSSIAGYTFCNSILMSEELAINRTVPKTQSVFCKKFVMPYGMAPNLLRLFYVPSDSRQMKKSHAYKLTNYKIMDSELFKKKQRVLQNYMVNIENQQSYASTLMKGKSIEAAEHYALSLLTFLQKYLKIKIIQLTIDFTIDQNKNLFFHQLKSVKSKSLYNLWQIGNPQEIDIMVQQSSNSALCKVCNVAYKKFQIEKIVTNKLISQFLVHLRNRGVQFYCYSIVGMKKQGMSYVCNYCYDVIVAQHKLINTERQFNRILNISNAENLKNTRLSGNHLIATAQENARSSQQKIGGGVFMNRMKAWRLFVYLEKIKGFQRREGLNTANLSIQFKFKNIRQKYTKTVDFESNKETSYIHKMSTTFQSKHNKSAWKAPLTRIKSAKPNRYSDLNQSKITQATGVSNVTKQSSRYRNNGMATQNYPLCLDNSNLSLIKENSSKQNISLEKAKVFGFYTRQSEPNLFANTNLEIILHINDQKYKGDSLTLSQLKNKDTCQRHSSQIFLFNDQMTYCKLEVAVGLVCDGQKFMDNLQTLSLVEKDNLLLPSKENKICKPLPDEWMEVFTGGSQVPELEMEQRYEIVKKGIKSKQHRLIVTEYEQEEEEK